MKYAREYLTNAATTFLVFATFFVLCLCVMLANQSGWFAFSEGNSSEFQTNREFTMTVEATGRTVFTATENVSEAVRDEIMGRVYPNPEAAHAAAHEAVYGGLPERMTGNAAYAHAVKKCTRRDGVVSLQTGAGDHVTNHRYDRNGYRFTKTAHRVYSHPAPVVTDVFYAKLDKGWC